MKYQSPIWDTEELGIPKMLLLGLRGTPLPCSAPRCWCPP